jgi:hypothetical protein
MPKKVSGGKKKKLYFGLGESPPNGFFMELGRENSYFMYRRPTLCTLHIAVDFLKSLEIAVVWGGGGGVVLGFWAYIISL